MINSHDHLVPLLIVGGADLNTPDEEMLTPLHMAARFNIIITPCIFTLTCEQGLLGRDCPDAGQGWS